MMWKKQILLASTRLKTWPNYVFSTSHLFFTPYDNVLGISLLIRLLVLLSYPSIPWLHWLYTLKKSSRLLYAIIFIWHICKRLSIIHFQCNVTVVILNLFRCSKNAKLKICLRISTVWHRHHTDQCFIQGEISL